MYMYIFFIHKYMHIYIYALTFTWTDANLLYCTITNSCTKVYFHSLAHVQPDIWVLSHKYKRVYIFEFTNPCTYDIRFFALTKAFPWVGIFAFSTLCTFCIVAFIWSCTYLHVNNSCPILYLHSLTYVLMSISVHQHIHIYVLYFQKSWASQIFV
jgi:hypothetical protein